ncbi:hypothetical protein CWC15_06205 [Pseudoalteromonas spongiae]|nr:hypothetical protein CWC15_06205 [Pseudoalteromonas spongiae]
MEMKMKKQRGQSLVVGLMFLPIIVLFIIYLYNVSQQNLHKTRLQNTADAAVLSSSQYLVRELNFKAYTNRAMIANHVAVGQYVGVASWFNFLVETIDNIEDVARYIPYVGPVFSQAEAWVDNINEVAVQPGMEIAVRATDLVNNALSMSQDIMAYASSATMIESLNDVIKVNDNQASLDAIAAPTLANTLFNDWRGFQGDFNRQDNSGRYNDFYKVILNSRDPFMKNRSHEWPFPFTIDIISFCFLGMSMNYWTKQAGGTDLVNNGRYDPETWTSMDTLSWHKEWFKKSLFSSGCRRSELEIGWGAAHAGEDKDTGQFRNRQYYGRSRMINRDASNRARYNESEFNNAYGGIYDFYSIKKINKSNDAPPVTIVVSKSINDIQSSKSLNIGTINEATTKEIDINIEEHLQVPRNQQSSASKARIYYYRANDLWKNSKFEYGNLYNPYWQNTLSDIDNNQRRDLLLLLASFNLAGA